MMKQKINNTKKAIVTGIMAVIPLYAGATEIVPAEGVNTLIIQHTEGTINIQSHLENTIAFDIEKISSPNKCQTTFKRSGDTYKIVTSEGMFDFKNCKANLTVFIPATQAVLAKIGFGKVHLSNLQGKIDVNLGSGTMDGNIESSDVRYEIGAGSSSLTWSKLPQKLQLYGKIGMGETFLNLPQKTSIDLKTKIGIGRYISAFAENENSPYKVNVESGVGNIYINKAAE